jgi:hypothetical protein
MVHLLQQSSLQKSRNKMHFLGRSLLLLRINGEIKKNSSFKGKSEMVLKFIDGFPF